MKNQTFNVANNNVNYRYFLEKTSNLLYELLIGEGDAKWRLRKNELNIIFILVLEVPEHLQGLQKEILALLNKKEASKVGEHTLSSSFQNSVSSMRNSTASKIIAKISSLYSLTKCNIEEEV